MKKAARTALIILAGLAIMGACTSSDPAPKADPNPGVNITQPTYRTQPTVDQRAQKAALCAEAMDHVEDGLNSIAEGAEYLPYADRATAREFLATAKAFVRTSIQTVQQCADLAPAEATSALSSLYELEATITQAERSL